MSFSPGSLVRARGREWVVLPGSADELLLVRPLGGTDDEETGILTALEPVDPAEFDLPDPTKVGDYRSARLLRDALRLGFRSSAGPFRSIGQIAVEPRPYQLVPLLMALKQDPVRLLIADDVGVGKTIEAALAAKELMARGDATRLAVLCPPHLAEQWQSELLDKFHIDAELVLPGTVARLERGLPYGTSLFDVYPNVVVSIDFIKSERRRDEFVRTCPELVIVDEAHGCTVGAERAKQQRYELVRKLSDDEGRHLILVTATPHSGKEDAFRSLIGLLEGSLEELPESLGGRENESQRRKLARYLIQRRRADIEHYLDTDTPFPKRQEREETYTLSSEYRKLFDRVLAYARETVRDPAGGQHRRRVRWWSALALLRSLASSPAAAAETLRNRAAVADTETEEEANDVGRRTVLDLMDEEPAEGVDVAPGADVEADAEGERGTRRRLRDMAKLADELRGKSDAKLQTAIPIVKELLKDGYRPILFCRFIPTAEYVAEELREALGKDVEVAAVTGKLVPADREQRVHELAESPKRVLVATDCLSEGINLQDYFDAVMHYDLSWNPTRHEQREGRVDRFGQKRETVRTLTYYGKDNQIDGIVLDVLIRKSKSIRDQLGVTVPVPGDAESVIDAIMEGLLLREAAGSSYEQLTLLEEYLRPKKEELFGTWDKAAEREKRSRTLFAQETLRPEEVARELEEMRRVIGSSVDVERFFTEAIVALGGSVRPGLAVEADLSGVPHAVKDAIGLDGAVKVSFDPSAPEGALYLRRTSPPVEGLAAYVFDTALDPQADSPATRCGVTRTETVARRTTALLLRFRFDVVTKRGTREVTQLAEDWGLLAFEGSPESPEWQERSTADALLQARPAANVPTAQAQDLVARVVDAMHALQPRIDQEAHQRAESLRESHERVRKAARSGVSTTVEPRLPVDILGVYVFLPASPS